MSPTWTLTFSILTALLRGVSMLRLVDLRVPTHTIRGQPVRLECHYDLEGEALYSVKWYKDLHEFFRFLPGDNPPAQIVNASRVNVDLFKSTDNTVTLNGVDLNGSGVYRCEVSGEAPAFQTVAESAQMVVVDLPDGGPQISGTRPRYRIGDTVKINCTSSRSRPAANLAWYINDEEVDDIMLRHYPILLDYNGLETSTLGLDFKVVRHKHFKSGDLKIKCLATIANLYWRSNEESVEGDRPVKAPVLEIGSRAYSSDASRASLSYISALLIFSLIIITYVSNPFLR